MACFLVPATEAVVTTIATKVIEKKEKACVTDISVEHAETSSGTVSLSRKMKWLNNMLWGGSALLAFEHVWHGEVAPFFPFLTAMETPDGTIEMLKEMATAGVGMAVLVTAVWGCMVATVNYLEKREKNEAVSKN